MVVGAGPVAEEKIEGLLRAGAEVRVVAPDATRRIRELARKKKLRWDERAFRASDLARCVSHRGCDVFSFASRANLPAGAAARSAVQRGRRSRALRFLLRRRWCGAANCRSRSRPEGTAPRSRSDCARKLEKEFGAEYEEWLKELGKIRKRLFAKKISPERRRSAASRACERGFVRGIPAARKQAKNRRV